MSDLIPSDNVDEDSVDSGVQEWQIREIRKGIEEADRGEFATDEEVAEVLKRLGVEPTRKVSPQP